MFENKLYSVSFHCFFPEDGACKHFQTLPLFDIPTWIDCYKFTHPTCISISVKIWFSDEDV